MTPSYGYNLQRRQMVETQIAGRGISNIKLLSAMGEIPRHMFVDDAVASQAYADRPLIIGQGQTISQPYMVALMSDAMQLRGSEKVLEIGTGSGYQTAILASLSDWVYSIERLNDLSRRAQRIMEELKIFNVNLKVGDGTKGWPDEAPFDAIMVTAGAPGVPEPLKNQLADGGRLVVPVGDHSIQRLKRVTREGDEFKEEDLGGCRFVDLIGEHGWKR